MDRLWQDIRYSARALAKDRTVLICVTLILAVGIGMNAAVFSIVDAVLVRSLPYREPDRLATVWERIPSQGLPQLSLSPPELQDYRSRSRAFEAMAGYVSSSFNLTGFGEPERLTGTWVSLEFFQVLGIQPAVGRTFLPEEDRPGTDNVVILSDRLWKQLFQSAPDVLRKRVLINGIPHTVVGVMPGGFQFPERETAAWFPLALTAEQLGENERGSHWMRVLARIRQDVSQDAAARELRQTAKQLQSEHPSDYPENSGWDAYLIPLREYLVGDLRPVLLVLWGAVGLLLLMTCASIANILLTRSVHRQKETAVRVALGAGNASLIRQSLMESLLLSLPGGAAGILLAAWGIEWFSRFAAPEIYAVREITINGRILAMGFLLTTVTSLLFGLAPALRVRSVSLLEALSRGGRGVDPASGKKSHPFIVGEIAVALVLLMGAGLMTNSLYRLISVDPGFRTSDTLTMRVSLPSSQYPGGERQRAFFQQALERLESAGGIESAGMVNHLPLGGTDNDRDFSIEGRGHMLLNVGFRVIGGNYFRTMGIPVVKGRTFNATDKDGAPAGVIINETMERTFFAGGNAIGAKIKLGLPDGPFPWMTILGVVRNVKHSGLDRETTPEIYISFLQPPLPDFTFPSFSLVVHGAPAARLADIARREIQALDRNLPVYHVASIDQLLRESTSSRRFSTTLLALFAAIAAILAAAGIYGVVAFAVSSRVRDFGIRSALGANRAEIFRLVIGQGLVLTAVGLMIGTAAGFALTHVLTGLLFHVRSTDLPTYLIVTGLLLLLTLAATAIPAAQATRIEPARALRQN